jgi:hypothetical protein
MDRRNFYFFKIFTFLLIGVIISFSAFGQESDEYLKQKIQFSKTELTVKQALDELNVLSNKSIVYSSKDDYLDYKIKFPSRSMTVKSALNEIERQAPIDIVRNKNHIVVKRRKLDTTYKISGFVRDALTNESLMAAQLFIAGSTKSTLSDGNGAFSFSLTPGTYELVCRYIGYEEERMAINIFQDLTQEISMKVSRQPIKEVNVFGNLLNNEAIEKGRPIALMM